MSTPGARPPIPFPAPVAGFNAKDPLPAMNPLFSPWMFNFEPLPQILRIRQGFVIGRTVAGKNILALGAYGRSKLFALVQSNASGDNYVLDVIAGTTAYDTASGAPDEAKMISFKNHFFVGVRWGYGGAYMNPASTWAAWGFTYSAATIWAEHITDYKGHCYISVLGYLHWGGLGAVTGDTSRIEVGELFKGSGTIGWMGTLTSPGDRAEETFFAFGNKDGEILVYAGDQPNADNWGQVGRFTVGPLFYTDYSNRSVLEIKNDIWICSATGIHSLRKLFVEGSDGSNTTVTKNIDPYWIQLVQKMRSTYDYFAIDPSLAFWPERNQVYVLMQGFLEEDGTLLDPKDYSTMFVHNLDSGAWCLYKLPIGTCAASGSARSPRGFLTYFNNNIYFVDGRDENIFKLSTGYKDEDQDNPGSFLAYDYELQSAFTDLQSGNTHKRIKGFEPIIKTDFNSDKVTMKAAADFGRSVSAAESVALLDGYQIPHYLVGVEGCYLQYRLEGESDVTSTDGLELYSVGVNI